MNQLQERPPYKESQRSLWRRYRDSKKARILTTIVLYVLPIAVLITLMYTVFIRPPFDPNEGRLKPVDAAAHTNNLDAIVTEVLQDMNAHSWDEQNQTTLINWRKSDISQINCGPNACDQRGHSTRKDILNDLRLVTNLYWYKSRHPSDTSMDTAIARMLPTVHREWGNTRMNKGWIYFTILHLRDYSHDYRYWDHTLKSWADAEYKLIDPLLGVPHGGVDSSAGSDKIRLQDGYRVDHALETGLALVDAGTRYQQPEWVAAGKRAVDVVIKQAYKPHYHLFGRIYLIDDPRFGSNELLDTQARMGEIGQEIETLIRTGLSTHTDAYLSLAKEMLDGLMTSPLLDPVNGGFQFKLYLGPYQDHPTDFVDKSIKETRQLHVLIAVHQANAVFNNRWAALEQNLINVATQRLFLPGPVPGFSYRVLPDGAMYPCSTCAPPHLEDWITSEADNIALEAMQTVLTKR